MGFQTSRIPIFWPLPDFSKPPKVPSCCLPRADSSLFGFPSVEEHWQENCLLVPLCGHLLPRNPSQLSGFIVMLLGGWSTENKALSYNAPDFLVIPTLHLHRWTSTLGQKSKSCTISLWGGSVSTEERHPGFLSLMTWIVYFSLKLSLTHSYLIFQEFCSSLCAGCAGLVGGRGSHHPERAILTMCPSQWAKESHLKWSFLILIYHL